MNPTETIHAFYKAFQQRDFKTMQSLYAEDATFSDPAFLNLNAKEVRAMWEMLIKRGKDLQLTYQILTEKEGQARAEWIATYTFSKTGRKVTNKIVAHMTIENGLIKTHQDVFNFHTWAKQALGTIGLLLGWTGFLRKKVQQEARKNLEKFMS